MKLKSERERKREGDTEREEESESEREITRQVMGRWRLEREHLEVTPI